LPGRTDTIEDSSGYNHNGIVIGAPLLEENSGRYFNSISFNGTTDSIKCGRNG